MNFTVYIGTTAMLKFRTRSEERKTEKEREEAIRGNVYDARILFNPSADLKISEMTLLSISEWCLELRS